MSVAKNFKKIDWEQFESRAYSSMDYEASEVDGHSITMVFNKDHLIGVYYHEMDYGSINPHFLGDDIIEYVDADPFYPEAWK